MPEGPQSRVGAVDAIVVLGCATALDHRGRLREGPLARRLDAAASAFAGRGGKTTIVVASGGRNWGGLVEADVMTRELVWRGTPQSVIVQERCSLTTWGNAQFSAALLARRGIVHAEVVTCAWHLRRAVALFRRAGVFASGVAAREPPRSWARRVWLWEREAFLTWAQTRGSGRRWASQ